MLKILQARLQQYVNRELPYVQAASRKGRGTRDQIANIRWVIKRAREFQKNTSISALLTMPNALNVWITTNCGKFWKRWEYQTTRHVSWEIFIQIRKQQLELDMEQQTGSKQEKEYVKPVYCHRAYVTYMHSTSWEMLSWMKHKMESRLLREISITSDTQMTIWCCHLHICRCWHIKCIKMQMLVIWSLVSLTFLKPAWISGSSWFMYYWSLAWRFLSTPLQAGEMSAFVQ